MKLRLAHKPIDLNNTRDRKGIRKAFKEYQGVIIRNSRVTARDSFKIELDNPEKAKTLTLDWQRDLFGGKEGIVSPYIFHTSGIIKHVYQKMISKI